MFIFLSITYSTNSYTRRLSDFPSDLIREFVGFNNDK